VINEIGVRLKQALIQNATTIDVKLPTATFQTLSQLPPFFVPARRRGIADLGARLD